MIEINKIYNEECLEGMKKIDTGSIDMILCDLPYGTTRNKWDVVLPLDEMWREYERIIKNTGCIALFSSQPFTTTLINSNKKLFRYDLVWDKVLSSGFLNANSIEEIFLSTTAGDDFLIIYEMPRKGHTVGFYETFIHTWKIKNNGSTAWKNRILAYANALDTRIRIVNDTSQPICVPDLKPGEDTTLSVEFDARGFEGTHEVIFEIENEDGTPCFPHKRDELRFEVTVKNNIN